MKTAFLVVFVFSCVHFPPYDTKMIHLFGENDRLLIDLRYEK